LASIKDIQATGEAFSPYKGLTALGKKMKFINFFLFLWVIFALLGPDPDVDCESGSGSASSFLKYDKLLYDFFTA
jgi:hypothetical protein